MTPDILWPDEDLVRECLKGNQVAWEALVEKHKRLVYSIPFKYGLPPEEAADVFQTVWSDLYRDLGKIEKAAALRGWLVTATARRCLLQKKQRQKVMAGGTVDPELRDESPDPAALHREAEKQQRLREAITQLPTRCQKIVRMLFFEHPPRPYGAVARELGLAEGSVGFIRGRCLAKLKTVLLKMEF
jgi:RNA polymerase sigma factor (sigma-70 family)